MKNEEKKKSKLVNLFSTNRKKGGCCNIELEEIPDEKDEMIKENETPKKDTN